MDKYAIQRKSVRFRLLLVGDNSPLTLQESIKPKQEKPSPSIKATSKAIKRYLSILGLQLKKLIIFSPLFPVLGKDTERNGRILLINAWLLLPQKLWIFWQQNGLHGSRLAGPWWGSPFSKGESPWGKARRAHWWDFELGSKQERNNSEPAHYEMWEGTTRLKGQGDGWASQPAALRCVINTAAHLKSYNSKAGNTGNRRKQEGNSRKLLQRATGFWKANCLNWLPELYIRFDGGRGWISVWQKG